MNDSLRYLGVASGAPPRRLLGLPDGPLSGDAIRAARDRQRQRVMRHPAANEPGAKRLLHEIDVAADALIEQADRDASVAAARGGRRGGIELTEFDHEVLATLIGAGGWNHESRSRLLAIAARYGVGGTGLMRVLAGLAAAMRSGLLRPQDGAPRSAIAQMAPWRPSEPSRITIAFEQLDEALAREVAGDTPGRLLRLVVFFVGIAMVGAYFLVVALSPSPQPRPSPREAAIIAAENARSAAPPEVAPVPIEREGVVTPVRWPSPPNLRGAAPPSDAKAALNDVANGPSELAALARKVQLEANRPSESVFRTWEQLQQGYARCWPLLDSVSRTAAIEASVAVLKPVQADEVAGRFLASWNVDPVVLDQPLGPWRGAWAAGMLGEVAARPSSPDAVAALAIDKLETMVPRRALLKGRGMSVFDGAAGAWLDRGARSMTVVGGDPAAFASRWERWFEAQQAVRSGAALQAAWLDAIGATLGGGLVISEAGPGSDLLGRLVASVDWTERSPDQRRARDAMTVWFTDKDLAASRLWALTSLLDLSYDAAWFVPEFVCDPGADAAGRAKLLDRILAAWPMPRGASATGGGIVVDRKHLERWKSLVERAEALRGSTDAERLFATVMFARLNTAAQAFTNGDEDLALADLAEIERELSAPHDRKNHGLATAGKTSGTDGEFTAAYQAAGRDEGKRRDELRSLRARPAAGDLGQRDAETLVSEALRGSPTEIRSLAQEIVADRFADGANVLQELLDQLASATTPEPTIAMIERVAGVQAGLERGPELVRTLRLALLRKLLSFQSSDAHAIDSLANDLAATLVERSRNFRIGFEEPPPDISPEHMVSRLVDQWRLKAGSIFLADPFPAPLEELDRRRHVRERLAEGAVQACAAGEVSLLELMSAVAVADKPALRQRVAEILAENSDQRQRAGAVTEQLLSVERAIARLYGVWFEPAADGAGAAT